MPLKRSTKRSKSYTRKSYKPFDCDLKQLRQRDDRHESHVPQYHEDPLISFLARSPTKKQLNQLYDITLLVARDDSIGESWLYVNNITRAEFDFFCTYLPIQKHVYAEAKQHVQDFIHQLHLKYKLNTRSKQYKAVLIRKIIQHKQEHKWLKYLSDDDIRTTNGNVDYLSSLLLIPLLNKKYKLHTPQVDRLYKLEADAYMPLAYEILSHVGVLP